MDKPVYRTSDEALEATDDFYSQEGFAYSEEQVTSWVARHMELPRSGRFLDLCCGDGIWSLGVKRCQPELELFGIDISPAGIEKARRLLDTDEDHFVVGDADTGLPWPHHFFNVILARGPGLYNQHDISRRETVAVIEQWHEALSRDARFYSVFASSPRLMGSYTPPEKAKLPLNRAPRRTPTVDFRGGKYHHSIESFHAPFWAAANVEIEDYRFVRNQHILVTRRAANS
jgi:SAM-dependent methyltransferase